jgi:phosphatidylinositol alpha 1,6-mannosyltransferase
LSRCRRLPFPPARNTASGLRLTGHVRREISQFRPDLFHIAVPDITGHSALSLARQMQVPAVSSFHTRYDTYLPYYGLGFLMPWFHRRLRAFYERCEHVYVPSRSMMDELARQGICGGNMRLWTRGVDHERFSPDRRSLHWRRERGIGDDDVLIAYAGRSGGGKEHEADVAGVCRAEGARVRTSHHLAG